MARMYSRAQAISAIVEPGTPETTTFNSACLLFRNLNVVQVDTAFKDLQELRTSFTPTGSAIGRQLIKLTPGMNLQAFAAANQRANYRLGRIFRMCGMAETLSGDGSTATYKFRSTSYESGAISFHEADVGSSGVLYRATSVFGDCVIAGSAGNEITVEAALTGLYAAPINQAAPTASAPTNVLATMKGEGMTITPQGGGALTPIGKSFTWNFGNTVSEDTDFNAASALGAIGITGRKSTLTVVIGMDATVAVSNWYADLTSSKDHTIVWTHNDSDGKGHTKVTLTGRLTNLPKADDVGFRTISLEYALSNATADAEAQIDVYCTA